MREHHPLAGIVVTLKPSKSWPEGTEYHIEDWWENVAGKSWMECRGNPACLQYAVRTGVNHPEIIGNNDVVYGTINHLGYLVHASELGDAK